MLCSRTVFESHKGIWSFGLGLVTKIHTAIYGPTGLTPIMNSTLLQAWSGFSMGFTRIRFVGKFEGPSGKPSFIKSVERNCWMIFFGSCYSPEGVIRRFLSLKSGSEIYWKTLVTTSKSGRYQRTAWRSPRC